MSEGQDHLTRIQKHMLEILSDGQPHTTEELATCLNDELSPPSNIQAHLTRIRKRLRADGQTVLCELWHNKICYRHVALIACADFESADVSEGE